jgi:signal transduction histidine kinase
MTHLTAPAMRPPRRTTARAAAAHDMLAAHSPGERSARWLFARDAAQVRRARHQVREELGRWGLAGYADLAELVVSELVTNALCHGDGKVDVSLTHVGGELRIGVHDDGVGRPVAGQPREDDEHGRGLGVISAMTEPHRGAITVTTDKDGPGKTVHVTIVLAADGDGMLTRRRWR